MRQATVPVTLVIPHLPERRDLLRRCVGAFAAGEVLPAHTIVVADPEHTGASATRNRGLAQVETPWVAFFDDDDIPYPNHLRRLYETAEATGADYIYPWHDADTGQFLACPVNGRLVNPLGVAFGPEQAAHLRRHNFIPSPVLCKTDTFRAMGGWTEQQAGGSLEDHATPLRVLDNGGTIAHCPHVTWRYVNEPDADKEYGFHQ